MSATTPPQSAPNRLTRLPSWLVSQVALQANRLVGDALGEAGFRKHDFAVLAALDEEGSISQAALGRRVWIDRSDLHAVVGELERKGLVARVRDEDDRRRNLVALTDAGAAALERLGAQVQAAQAALLEPLSAAERRELRRLLTKLVGKHGSRPS
jgi:MarR family transcriptional regulator, lower aerobic nicotinate degradation pathway regulator